MMRFLVIEYDRNGHDFDLYATDSGDDAERIAHYLNERYQIETVVHDLDGTELRAATLRILGEIRSAS
jgi:hypothetical protein